MMHRAYSTFEIKRANLEDRVIEGIASTPSTDLAGDIVEPLGMKAGNNIPFLWQHAHEKPLGHVIDIRATDNGVWFKAQLAKIEEAGILKDRLDEAWQSIKSGLVRGISIGFSGTDWEPIRSGGRRFKSWMLHEISAVTIPCNSDCSIQTVKRYAASSHRVVRIDGLVNRSAHRVVKLGHPFSSAKAPSSIASATLKAVDEEYSDPAGDGTTMLAAGISACAKATDSELAAIRSRLEAIEARK